MGGGFGGLLALEGLWFSHPVGPILTMGGNRRCYVNTVQKPFLFSTFLEGSVITNVWYDIEGSGLVAIPLGGHANFQEAAQAFEYIFNNIGDVACTLKVQDELTLVAQNSLTMSVVRRRGIPGVSDRRKISRIRTF